MATPDQRGGEASPADGAADMVEPRRRGLAASPLWRQPDFLALWTAQTVSDLGSGVTRLALPLTAVLTLQATAFEMGLLHAALNIPVLLVGLLAGVWVDRLRRRPILIAADVGRALLIGSIPLVAVLGSLRMEYLWVVAFLVGTLSVFFDVAVTSVLPALVPRGQLVEANSKLQLSSATAAIAGPGLAGWLVSLVTAPLALVVDALSFLVSAAVLGSSRTPEPAPQPRAQQPVWREIGEGVQFLFGHPVLRPLTLATALGSLGTSIQQTVLVLYVTQELGVAPALLGTIVATGGAAAVLGTLLAGPLARWRGPGPAVIWSQLVIGVGSLLLPVAAGALAGAVPVLVLANVLVGSGMRVFSINQISLRQAVTPDRVLGRVNASRRVLVFGVAPLGALVGGVLGTGLGLRPTLLAGACAVVLSFLMAYWSPLRSLMKLDDQNR